MLNSVALRQKKDEIVAKAKSILTAAQTANRELTSEEQIQYDALMIGATSELSIIKANITRTEAMIEEERSAPASGTAARAANPEAGKKPFASFGEQLQAVATADKTGRRTVDPRLHHANEIHAALGSNETVPAEGGWLITPEYSQELIKRTFDTGLISGLTQKMPMASNRLVMHAVDEDSRVDGSRWGGIQAYWLAEAGTYTSTKPKFREMQLVANKLIGLCYATEEQLADGPALGGYMGDAFPQEFNFKIDTALLTGSGAGMPLGIYNSGAVIQVAKDGSQTAATITTNNILNMWKRFFARSRASAGAAWLINQDTESQLYPLTLGSGTAVTLLYTPPGLNGNTSPYGKLMGLPVIPVEQASTLGTVGDIALVDMKQYLLAQKSDVRADVSIHVAFLTGESAFRFQLRLDGQPMWKKPLTPYQGANTLSPFITLATRS